MIITNYVELFFAALIASVLFAVVKFTVLLVYRLVQRYRLLKYLDMRRDVRNAIHRSYARNYNSNRESDS